MASVRVEERDGRGRCLVAGKRFEPGEVIVLQRPYEAVLNDDEVEKRCHYTFADAESLWRCMGCKFAWYSSKAAQRAAWPAHRPECRALAALPSGRGVPAPVRLAARILWKRARQEVDGSSAPWEGYADVESLQTHWDKFSAELQEDFKQMGLLTRQYMAAGGTEPGRGLDAGSSTNADEGEGSAVQEEALLLTRLAINKRSICPQEPQQDPIGAGIYPLLAMANHSCTPNAAENFEDNGRISFRAIAPILPGEEVTIAYIPLGVPRYWRRYQLCDYHFDIDEGVLRRGADRERAGSAKRKALIDSSFVAHLTRVCSGEELIGSGLVMRSAFPPVTAAGYFKSLTTSAPVAQFQAEPGHIIECWGPAFQPGGCFYDGLPLQQLLDQLQEIVSHGGAAMAATRSGRSADAVRAIASANQAADGEGLEAAVKLPYSHMNRVFLDSVGSVAAATQGNSWDVALEWSRRAEAFKSIAYPRVWPALGLLYANAATLEDLVFRLPEDEKLNLQHAHLCPRFVRAFATAAQRILQITHPPDSETLAFVSSLLSDLPAADHGPDCDDFHVGLLKHIE